MRLLISAIVWVAMATTVLAGGVPVVFECPADRKPGEVFIQFLSTSGSISGTYKDAQGKSHPLKINQPYSLAKITSKDSVGGGAPKGKPAVMISNFVSGRIYINYASSKCLNGLNDLGNGYQPGANNPEDNNYSCRYQYLEPTIFEAAGGDGTIISVDLSYIDFFSISLSLKAHNAPNAANSPQVTRFDSMKAAGLVSGASRRGQSNILPAGAPLGHFARIIGPGLADAGIYHDWSDYIESLAAHKPTRIAGVFAGVGQQPSGTPATQMQTYDYNATFSSDGSVALTSQPGSGNGRASFIPSALQGAGIGDAVVIDITGKALNGPNGIYGNNPSYTVTRNGVRQSPTRGITNDVYGWIVGDLLAGMIFGYPGSAYAFKGSEIGDMSSVHWWGGRDIDGAVVDSSDTPGGKGIYYATVQPKKRSNYNVYAGVLSTFTPGYGSPLADRLGQNLLMLDTTLDPNGYLEVTIHPDKQKSE